MKPILLALFMAATIPFHHASTAGCVKLCEIEYDECLEKFQKWACKMSLRRCLRNCLKDNNNDEN